MAGKRSRQTEKNFSRKSIIKIWDNPRSKKGFTHHGESISPKGRYDRESDPRVKRNNEVYALRRDNLIGCVAKFME